MRYLSVCSGIEAATVAWHSLGWTPAAFAEVEPFPSAVLAHHYPDVPNVGDMTKFKEWDIGAIDILVGGTPCQSFSIAGLRKGLDDARGNLALTYCQIADKFDPEWCVWENVPGVLSSKDNAFGCFLAGLVGADEPIDPNGKWAKSGVVSGPKRTAAWRILDAQYFGVAQRRRRVFVLAVRGSRNWRAAAALFPVGESMYGDSAPSREQGQNVTGTISSRTTGGGGGLGTDFECAGGLQPAIARWPAELASTLNAAFGSKLGLENQHINSGAPLFVPGPAQSVALRGREGGATAELGDDLAGSIRASTGGGDKPHVMTIAMRESGQGYWMQDEIAGTLRAEGEDRPSRPSHVIGTGLAVRRLTPRECERLQGFPDDYTLVPNRGKPAADGPRYKALGNSMATVVMNWLGRRIEFARRM